MEGMVGSTESRLAPANPCSPTIAELLSQAQLVLQETPALYSNDRDWQGFEWFDLGDTQLGPTIFILTA